MAQVVEHERPDPQGWSRGHRHHRRIGGAPRGDRDASTLAIASARARFGQARPRSIGCLVRNR
jgi:hypothetical protein